MAIHLSDARIPILGYLIPWERIIGSGQTRTMPTLNRMGHTTTTAALYGSPVIGFAADGFPIYGSYFFDESGGGVHKAISGYTLRAGSRPTGSSDPGGTYDGTYIDDYEFTGGGDLDECNGMTVNGQYGYYVTASYPWIISCHSGVPHSSFDK